MNEYIGYISIENEICIDERQPIVRCRDCKYLCDDGSTWGCGWHCSCLTTNDGTPPDGFCKWGERRSE